ncbi:MAG TPA: hypothetical protein VFB80_14930 [Pirellulaceae bacterium]|nr:hypothetical protein [Pirellulaceae bacterium]
MTRRLSIGIAVCLIGSGAIATAQSFGPQPGQAQQPQQRQAYGPQSGPAQNPPPQPVGGNPIRPVAGQQPAGQAPPPGNLPPANIAPSPQPPQWALTMSPEEADWINRVLAYWENHSNKIKTFSCNFQCWEYNAHAPLDVAQRYSEGVIKYAQPDKGLFRVEKLTFYEPPPRPNPAAQPAAAPAPPEKPKYVVQDKSLGEHWVCDGKQVFQFEARTRRVIVLPLPVEMQGKAIADGPLPFLFGAKAETIKARYWVRRLPQTGNGKYWLEAVPKSRDDARNFKMVHIVLEEKDFLPDMLTVFEPNSSEVTPYRKTYVFPAASRQTTTDKMAVGDLLKALDIFRREFYEPTVPSGWKKEVQSDVVSVINPPPGARPPQEAQRPPQKSPLPLPR